MWILTWKVRSQCRVVTDIGVWVSASPSKKFESGFQESMTGMLLLVLVFHTTVPFLQHRKARSERGNLCP